MPDSPVVSCLNPGTADEREVSPAGEGIQVRTGDLLRAETGGGGGWGHPYDRDPQDVARDVLEGFVSKQAAEKDYGVAISDSLEIDSEATEALRSSNKPEILPVDRGPHAEHWLGRLGVT